MQRTDELNAELEQIQAQAVETEARWQEELDAVDQVVALRQGLARGMLFCSSVELSSIISRIWPSRLTVPRPTVFLDSRIASHRLGRRFLHVCFSSSLFARCSLRSSFWMQRSALWHHLMLLANESGSPSLVSRALPFIHHCCQRYSRSCFIVQKTHRRV